MDEGWIYAAVISADDGSVSVIGTCAVAAGAAAFAVSCGNPRARVVKVPSGIAEAIADMIAAKCVELTDEGASDVRAACVRALGSHE